MNASTALVRVPKGRVAPAGLVALRRRMIERALDEAAVQPRVWLEALEPRRMMSAGTFGDHGVATLKVAGVDLITWPQMVGAGAGKVYVVGSGFVSSDQTYSEPKWVIARLNADGTPDETFGRDGSGSEVFAANADATVSQAFLGADGKLVVVGQMGGDGYAVGRFNADGSFDRGFNGGAVQGIDNGPSPIAGIGGCRAWPTADGGTVVVWTTNGDVAMERLNATGEPDTTLSPTGRVLARVDFYRDGSPGGGWPDAGEATLLAARAQPDGGAVVFVGLWDGPQNAAPPIERVRLDAAGNVVATAVVRTTINSVSFDANGDWTAGSDDWVVIAPDGSAYIAASSPPSWNQLERINPDGSRDTHFGQGGIVTFADDTSIWPPALAPDGKLYVYVNTDAAGGTVRLNPDGSIDPTFNGGAPADFYTDVEIPPYFLPDGSLLVAGAPDDATNFPLMQVGADGTMPDAPSPAAAAAPSQDGGDEPLASVPAAWGGTRGGATGAGAPAGLFASAAGATVWDPAGVLAVYE